MGNENASHPMIPVALGFYTKHLILGMEIKVCPHEIIFSLRIRISFTNEVINFMFNIKLGKSQLNDIFQAVNKDKMTLQLMNFMRLMQGIIERKADG